MRAWLASSPALGQSPDVRPVRVLVVVFLAAVAAGFGAGRSLPDDQVVAVAAPTTTIPPEPVHVVLAGDSVMAGLVPAIEAAVEPTGGATVDFVLTPAILRDPSIRFSWSQELERLSPDLVVMFVGTWEDRAVRLPDDASTSTSGSPVTGSSVDPASAGWADEYRREVVDPWLELITGGGARVLWIGAPPVADPERAAFFEELNAVFSRLPDDWSQVAYLDPTEALGPPGDGFADVVVLPDGTPVRLRQVDGLHLCPSGAQLLAELVVTELRAQAGVAAADGWQDGAWREDPGLYPAAGCPPPATPAAPVTP